MEQLKQRRDHLCSTDPFDSGDPGLVLASIKRHPRLNLKGGMIYVVQNLERAPDLGVYPRCCLISALNSVFDVALGLASFEDRHMMVLELQGLKCVIT